MIDVPPASQVHKQVVRKRAEVRAIELDPLVRLAYVEVEPPDMHTPSGDLERLQKALTAQWDIPDLRCEPALLPILQKTLRQGDWKVTAAVHDQDRIIARNQFGAGQGADRRESCFRAALPHRARSRRPQPVH